MKFTFSFLLSLLLLEAHAQKDSVSKLTLSAYVDVYYSYDFSQPDNHERPPFFYNYNRHNELNINLAYIKAAYSSETVRANLTLMAGTYSQYNLAHEQELLRHVFEANAGVKLLKNQNLWLDAGILPSHIVFENAIGKDCWTLTRSMMAENSPYYEAGARLNYTSFNKKIVAALLYLNGWQRIQKLPGNQTPAFGSQLTYTPNTKVILNWSTYAGNEQPDSSRRWRYYHNLYGMFKATEKLGITLGFDIGMQQQSKGSHTYDIWYTPVVMARYRLHTKIYLAARAEYYQDTKGVIIPVSTTGGFKTSGYSLNMDYAPSAPVLLRIEGRMLHASDKLFVSGSSPTNVNYFLTTSMAVSF